MSTRSSDHKKFLFIIQGEGRGHMTQAISLYRILKKNGHEVCEVIVGKSIRRQIPDFFYNQLDGCKIDTIESPNFITDKKNKSIRIRPTVIANLKRLKTFRRSLNKLHQKVLEHQPDVIVNFYDFLGGIYNRLYPHSRFICIAHQYLAQHPEFPFAKGNFWDRQSLKIANKVTSMKALKRLALSFSDGYKHCEGIVITPPLLREELFSVHTLDENFILVYMVNDGYAEEVMNFHRDHPEVSLHCFWDRKNAQETEVVDETLCFHQINDVKFIEKMAACSGYASTAGFESICEAMLLGKPVMMVPVAGQYEQACNAIDAERAGAGICSDKFDIDILLDYISQHKSNPTGFKEWVAKCETIILPELTG
ncbi:MAG: glycosyltransferase family protein [Cyclobacteriaceae bacterium]